MNSNLDSSVTFLHLRSSRSSVVGFLPIVATLPPPYSPPGARRSDFFCDRFRLSATLRFFEFRDRGRFVRRIFSIACVRATAFPSRIASS